MINAGLKAQWSVKWQAQMRSFPFFNKLCFCSSGIYSSVVNWFKRKKQHTAESKCDGFWREICKDLNSATSSPKCCKGYEMQQQNGTVLRPSKGKGIHSKWLLGDFYFYFNQNVCRGKLHWNSLFSKLLFAK